MSTTHHLTGKSLIGRWTVDVEDSARTFSAYDPKTGMPIEPEYYAASDLHVEQAVRSAHRAFLEYRELPNAKRAEFLRAIATCLEQRVDAFVERVPRETALPEPRVRGELARTAAQMRMFADIVKDGSWVDARIDPAIPDREPLPRPDCRSMLRPLGPVVVFGASNFPLAFSAAGGDTAAALAAGCSVIVKAHSAHPGTSELAGQAILDAATQTGIPDGVYSVLFGSGNRVGVALVRHPLIKAVGFTGSFTGGTTIYDLAVSRDEPIPVYAEMGSVNPVVVLPEALAERTRDIAEKLHQSAMMGAGQFCTNPGLVFYDGNAEFRNTLIRFYADTPPVCMLSETISSAYNSGVEQLRDTKTVEPLMIRSEVLANANVQPALVEIEAEQLAGDPTLASEVFGPLTMLVRFQSHESLLAAVNALPGQLTASIHATDKDLQDFAELLPALEFRAGRLVFGQFPTGVEVGHAMVHGGPYPATTDARSTSVGATSILRFARPVCFQNFPDSALPEALQQGNPLRLRRLVDGRPETT